MESGYYPLGAENDISAPYNEEEFEKEPKEVEVTITLTKTFILEASKQDCLQEVLEENHVLPNNIAAFVEKMFEYDLNLRAAGMCKYIKDAIQDCKNWKINDLEITEL